MFMSSPVEAAQANLKAIFTGPRPQDVSVSADGAFLAIMEESVLWDEDKNRRRLVVRRLDSGEDVRNDSIPEGVSHLYWHADKPRLAFIVTGQDKSARLMDWDLPTNSVAEVLSRPERIRVLLRAGDDFLYVCGHKNDESVTGVVEYPSAVRSAPLVRASTGATVAELPENAGSPSLSADGRRLAYTSQPTTFSDDRWHTDLFVLDLAAGERRRIGPAGRGAGGCRFAPQGERLVFLSSGPVGYPSRTDLFVLDTIGGEERNLSARFDRDVSGILGFSEDGQRVIATMWAGVRMQYVSFDLGSGERRVHHEGTVFGAAVSRGEIRAWIEAPPSGLPQVFISSGKSTPPPLDALRAAVIAAEPPPAEACPQRIIQYRNAEGRILDGLLLTPKDSQPPWPTVLHVHGGPSSPVYDSLARTDCLQPIAAAGYAVFFPAFRGSGGYDEAFLRAAVGNFGDGPLDDCVHGMDHLVAEGIADPQRQAIIGGSFGGYLTLYALTHTQRFRCGVAMCALSDLISDISSPGRSTYACRYFGGPPWERFEKYWQGSPLSRVADLKTPVLLLHGDADGNTDIQHAHEMAFALRTLGRTFRFKRYPGEGHGFGQPKVRLDIIAEIVTWLQTYV
jgi:dipeptidyl aminopeptidase/acylaminoacyl peptidase